MGLRCPLGEKNPHLRLLPGFWLFLTHSKKEFMDVGNDKG
jgi:hypothetical protein